MTRSEKGFTLIEVVIAIALLGVDDRSDGYERATRTDAITALHEGDKIRRGK